jgi:hypothetical protein
MENVFHLDWLRRFREDLRLGDMESLGRNAELAGLELLLDPEFLALTCQHDARAVVVLIASVGQENSEHTEPYQRLLASYQCLQRRISLEDAASICSKATSSPSGFYHAVLSSALENKPLSPVAAFPVKEDDLQFAIELLINTGNGTAALPLMKTWHTIDHSAMPWLRTCRATAARGRYAYTRQECVALAATARLLIDCAPKDQPVVTQEMRVQCAELALKARNGAMASKVAQEAFDHDPCFDRRFVLAKAQVLNGELSTAITNMHDMVLSLLNKEVTLVDSNSDHAAPTFDVSAAEDTLLTVNHLLQAKGLQPFLMSGTLLGYARDGALLPHDKDIDIGILGWEDQFTVAEALLEAGHFQIDLAQLGGQHRFLLSAHDMRNGMAIDFFLFHDKGDHFLHGIDFDMGFTQNFRFSRFALDAVEFLGERFFVPADFDLNLSENYGDWRTPASAYVVTVESPALCDTPNSRQLLVYIEILKTFTKHMKPERLKRIADYLDAQHSPLLDKPTKQQLRQWAAMQQAQKASSKDAATNSAAQGDTILMRLMSKIQSLGENARTDIANLVAAGTPGSALDLLHNANEPQGMHAKGLEVLKVYLLHLSGQYDQANRTIDQLIGMNLSEQLVMDNCPNEAEIMQRWDTSKEGVSILCTTFNHARFISMALAGFFSQISTHPFEVIVRDDASTDGTGDILKKWEERYPTLLKVIRLSKNTYQQGQSPMLATMPFATQPLMAMCEGDDFWIDSDKLQQQAELLQNNPAWSAVTHNHFELDESTGRLAPGRSTKIRGVIPRQDLVNINLVLWGHTLMVRRSLLDMPHYRLQDGVLGDQVMTSMLGSAGEVFFIGNLFGSVARRNLFSTYTPLSSADKQRRRINTRRFLAPILVQRGEQQAAQRLLRWCDMAEKQTQPVAA